MAKSEFSIEKGIFPGVYPGSWAIPKEMPLKKGELQKRLRIGIPRETFFQENRVAITPETVGVIIANGHQVYIEHEAGEGARYTDHDYAEQGVQVFMLNSQLQVSSSKYLHSPRKNCCCSRRIKP